MLDALHAPTKSSKYLFQAIKVAASADAPKTAVDRDLVEACRAAVRGGPLPRTLVLSARSMREEPERAQGRQGRCTSSTPGEEEVVEPVAERARV